MGKLSTLVIIKSKQIKITVKFHFAQNLTKKINNNKQWAEGQAKDPLSYTANGSINRFNSLVELYAPRISMCLYF